MDIESLMELLFRVQQLTLIASAKEGKLLPLVHQCHLKEEGRI